ncbi:CDP-glycerol glycerophosphotransferase family protein [Ornithinibacillus bavariensis]|uniref:CDP-glycerol glycerophosphotransferase family protein n=1 Tax=Ornithinibacillus bavariensis TaxID=545502 RepID=UPI000EC7D868|nr:spore coat protein CotS [Ornithinibacillus sp.]
MTIRKIIQKIIPYNIRFLLNPLLNHLKQRNIRLRSIYTKTWEEFPINDHIIFYEAYHGRNITGNPYAIFSYLIDDSRFKNFQHIWAVRKDTVIPSHVRNLPNVTFVLYQSVEYVKYLAIGKYLINDTSFPSYFQKRDGQIYVNTWHGTPLKTLGLDIKQRGVVDHQNIQRNFLYSDFLVTPNSFTAEKLLNAFDINNIYGGTVLDTGYPRVDLLYKADKNKIKRELNIPSHKKVILYAPTWRGKVGDEEDQSLTLKKNIEKVHQHISNDYILLLKSHYFESNHLYEQGNTFTSVPNSMDSNELLSIVDILITDYSSIFFEFLPTERPVIFYTDDLKEYERDRGLYIPMQNLPGPLCQDIEEVINCINDIEQVKSIYRSEYDTFLKRYCYHDDGQATTRFVDTVFFQRPTENTYKAETNKKKLLIYGGGFLNNGITSSIISLLNSIDYDKYDITLIDHGTNKNKIKWANMEKVNKNVHHIFRGGTWNASLLDIFRHTLFLYTGNKKYAPVHIYEREYSRIVGLSKFDIGIDFGGYNPFWSSFFAYGKFKKKCIYLHSDMEREVNKKINNKYPHKRNLGVIFSLYNQFDKVLSVSELTHNKNLKNLEKYVNHKSKMDYVINPIDYKRIFSLRNNNVQFENKEKTESTSYRGDIQEGFPFPDNKHVNFITIGRLSPEKDHQKLIKAFTQVSAVHNHVRLYIVGDGSLKKDLIQLVQELNIEDKIIFTGHLENPYPLLDHCDCFILSSNYEGQGIVLLEALILGLPVISTDIPGPRSIIEDSGFGMTVENSVFGLVEGMNAYLKNNNQMNNQFDYKAYQNKAMNMFYEKVCQLN